MKQLFILTLIILVFITGCKQSNTDLIFGETPDVRMNAAQKAFKEQLISAPYGWKVSNSTVLKGTFGYYMDFDADGNTDRVRMISDFNTETISKTRESAYRVKLVNAPILSFETYSYIHLLGDPNSNVAGGVSGVGFKGDIEFVFERATADSIFLVGRKFSTKMILSRATQEEQASYLAGGYQQNVKAMQNLFTSNIISLFDVDAITYQLSANPNTKQVQVMSIENGEIKLNNAAFYYSIDGMEIPEGLKIGNKKLTKLLLTGDKFYAIMQSGDKIEVRGSTQALLPLKDMMGNGYKGLNTPFNTKLPGTNDLGFAIQYQFSSLVIAYPNSYDKCEVNWIWDAKAKQIVVEGLLFKNATITPTKHRYDFNYNETTGYFKCSNKFVIAPGYGNSYFNKYEIFFRDNEFKIDYHFEGGNIYGKITSKDTKTIMTFLLY